MCKSLLDTNESQRRVYSWTYFAGKDNFSLPKEWSLTSYDGRRKTSLCLMKYHYGKTILFRSKKWDVNLFNS